MTADITQKLETRVESTVRQLRETQQGHLKSINDAGQYVQPDGHEKKIKGGSSGQDAYTRQLQLSGNTNMTVQ